MFRLRPKVAECSCGVIDQSRVYLNIHPPRCQHILKNFSAYKIARKISRRMYVNHEIFMDFVIE